MELDTGDKIDFARHSPDIVSIRQERDLWSEDLRVRERVRTGGARRRSISTYPIGQSGHKDLFCTLADGTLTLAKCEHTRI